MPTPLRKEYAQSLAILSQTVASVPFENFTCGALKKLLSQGIRNSFDFAGASPPSFEATAKVMRLLKSSGVVKAGVPIVSASGNQPGIPGGTNTLQVRVIE